MFESEVLTIEQNDHVATLWLDNPERRNAMGWALWKDLPLAMADLSENREVRAVVIAAKGPCFTVGLDLKDSFLSSGIGDGDSGGPTSDASKAMGRYREIKRLQASITSVAQCSKPTIAAVHGYCIGGGIDLITACDIRVASHDAVFSVRETKMAIVADLGTLQRLPRIIAAGHVAELAYSGKDISADRAKEIGLVNDVLPDAEEALSHARELASSIAANSPLVVAGTRTVLQAGQHRSVEEGLDFVAAWNAGFLVSNDLIEAMSAFMGKRPPEFTGS